MKINNEPNITIYKAVVLSGMARVAVVDATEATNALIRIHDLSPVAAIALGKAITVGAVLTSEFKSDQHRLNMVIDGGGPLGKLVVAGGNGMVKGFVENPVIAEEDLQNPQTAVGKDGTFMVMKDLGLKEPYIGKSEMVSGGIGDDFASYLLKSEGKHTAVSLGVLLGQEGATAAGGIVVEALPSATEDVLFVLEDIVENMGSIAKLLAEKGAEEVLKFYFGHFDSTFYDPITIKLRCECFMRIANIVRGLGEKECYDALAELGKLEVKCDYCKTNYVYTKRELDLLFRKQS